MSSRWVDEWPRAGTFVTNYVQPETWPAPNEDLAAEFLSQLWQPKFPRADEVELAASMLPGQPCGAVQEGPSWRISVTPGRVVVWTKDEADAERTENRQRDAGCTGTRWDDQDDGEHECTEECDLFDDEPLPRPASRREITGWSKKSRASMCASLSDLDYQPLFTDPTRLPAMLTLTYPGDWFIVAPNGRAVKRHLDKLRKRYFRAYGESLTAIWKLEFQHRGAPHFHMLIRPPHALVDGKTFRQWISATWADIVGHPDSEERRRHQLAGTGIDYAEGLKANDPRKVAVYFTKHGAFAAKEYQHCVPEQWQAPGEGPGRFWGYWHLNKVIATRAVSREIGAQAGRIVRRYSRAQQVTREVSRPRTKGGAVHSRYPEIIGLAGKQLLEAHTTSYRKTRTRAVRAKNNRGWLAVNNGPDFAAELGYALHQHREQRQRDTDRRELNRCGLWDTTLARARRLQPSARRDALLARLAE